VFQPAAMTNQTTDTAADGDFRCQADFSHRPHRLFWRAADDSVPTAGTNRSLSYAKSFISRALAMAQNPAFADAAVSGRGVGFAIRADQSSRFQELMAIQGRKFEGEAPALQSHAVNDLSAPQTDTSVLELGSFRLKDGAGEAYHEGAFQYFLEIERKRSEALNRPFLLMLIDFKKINGADRSIDPESAGNLCATQARSVRETDCVGWYREGRVVGAVLTQHGEPEGDDLSDVVKRRVGARLEAQLPRDLVRGLQVRVYQLSPHATFRGEQ
jgi:hypothetical protein